jgi:hypothetical protein
MNDLNLNQWLKQQKNDDDSIEQWMESFLWDKKAENVASGTIQFYRIKIEFFLAFCKEIGIEYY